MNRNSETPSTVKNVEPSTGLRWLLRRAIRFLSYVLAATFIAGVLSPWLADRVWLCEIACHFQVQYIVGLSLLAAIFIATGRRKFGGGLLLAALLAFTIHWLPFYWSEFPSPKGSRSLRLLSANLHFHNPSHELFLELVDREQPDVILLFELSEIWAPDLKFLDQKYPHSKIMPSPGHSGCGVYSRLPLESVAILGVDPYPNFVIEARVLVDDAVVTIFGTHPLAPYTAAEQLMRNAQLANLAGRIGRSRPHTILAGDFNTSSWSPCFGNLMRATGTRDTRRGFGICPTFPATIWPLQTPIDHCLVTPDISVLDRRVGPNIGSDHLPIIVDLRLD